MPAIENLGALDTVILLAVLFLLSLLYASLAAG
jgi:hypothetical protein